MAMLCVSGAKLCDGCMECQEEPDLLCEYCEKKIKDIYYEIGNEILCPECMDDMYKKELD